MKCATIIAVTTIYFRGPVLCINGVNAVFGNLLRLQLSKQQVKGNGLDINLVVALTCIRWGKLWIKFTSGCRWMD